VAFAVTRNLYQATLSVQIIKVSGRVGFQAGRVIVTAGRCGVGVKKILVGVRLVITVAVDHTRDLVAAEHIDLIVNDL
jgi:hypothetical protein